MEIIKRIILYPIRVSFKILITPAILFNLIKYLIKRKNLLTLSIGEILIKMNETYEISKIVLGLTFHVLTLGIFVKPKK